MAKVDCMTSMSGTYLAPSKALTESQMAEDSSTKVIAEMFGGRLGDSC